MSVSQVPVVDMQTVKPDQKAKSKHAPTGRGVFVDGEGAAGVLYEEVGHAHLKLRQLWQLQGGCTVGMAVGDSPAPAAVPAQDAASQGRLACCKSCRVITWQPRDSGGSSITFCSLHAGSGAGRFSYGEQAGGRRNGRRQHGGRLTIQWVAPPRLLPCRLHHGQVSWGSSACAATKERLWGFGTNLRAPLDGLCRAAAASRGLRKLHKRAAAQWRAAGGFLRPPSLPPGRGCCSGASRW